MNVMHTKVYTENVLIPKLMIVAFFFDKAMMILEYSHIEARLGHKLNQILDIL